MTTSTAPAQGEFKHIPIDQLHESKLNPRRRFHDVSLQELAASITEHGILTPLLARPTKNGKAPAYELAAGHRRFRAATIAQLVELPVVVREMTDTQFLEVLTIENLQREDIHPLEEAQGFADLIKHAGYDVTKIANRVGRSHRYVYDRLRLMELTPELQQIYFNNEITTGHAILLARLTTADQMRAAQETQALFNVWSRFKDSELELDDRRKPMSVRELQQWIDQHVRFEVTAEDVPELFPETAAVVAPAIEQAEKVISITHNYHVDPGAKPEDGERTYTSQSWKRADGREGTKECDRSVMGVIVVGPDRGQAFRVCTDKKKCTTHWGAEIREANKRAKAREVGTTTAPAAPKRDEWQERQNRENAARAKWNETLPQVLEAVAARVKKMPAGSKSALGLMLIEEIGRQQRSKVSFSSGVSSEDLVRYLAFQVIAQDAGSYHAFEQFPKKAKALGLDLKKILATSPAPAKAKPKARAK